jgi:hypothetical protein
MDFGSKQSPGHRPHLQAACLIGSQFRHADEQTAQYR